VLILFLHIGQPGTTTPLPPCATDGGFSTKWLKSWRRISPSGGPRDLNPDPDARMNYMRKIWMNREARYRGDVQAFVTLQR
jgi:hypothetical protein